jgi:hypothetical protein
MDARDDRLDHALADAALGWFSQKLNQAELADAIEVALRANSRCLVEPEEACDLGCEAMECRRYPTGRQQDP